MAQGGGSEIRLDTPLKALTRAKLLVLDEIVPRYKLIDTSGVLIAKEGGCR